MKIRVVSALALVLLASVPSRADTPKAAGLTSTTDSGQSTFDSVSPYNQLVSIQAGPFRPASLVLSNGSYVFDYNATSLDSYMVEAGWAARLLGLGGSWFLEENLAFSSFSGALKPLQTSTAAPETLSAYLLGLDSRVMWAWDWFPWKSLIPFVDGGVQWSFYYQSGTSDLESTQGNIANFVAGAGARLWLNRASSMSQDHVNRFAAFPLFITAKVNHIFPQDNGVNLSSTDFMAGLSVGL
jgi:hypothetical protein